MPLENIKTYYINLDFRMDRNKDVIEKLINKLGFSETNIYRFSAIDGKKLSDELKNKNYIDDEIITMIKNLDIRYKTTILACLLSHYFLLKQIVNNPNITDNELIFIFEDDFFINEEYLQQNSFSNIILELENYKDMNDFDMIYLGGRFYLNFNPLNHNNFFKKISNESNLYLRTNGSGYNWDRTTHNYIVTKKSAKNLLNIMIENFRDNKKIIHEIDSLYCNRTLKSLDYFPHIFYSPLNYTSDIQLSDIFINTKNI